MFNKLKTFSEKHIPENLQQKMKELGATIAPQGAAGGSGSGSAVEKPELVPLRALQKVPPANPEGTPEMVRGGVVVLFCFVSRCFAKKGQKKKCRMMPPPAHCVCVD
jgi:hypothetical protein